MNLWEKYDVAFKSHALNTAFCISNINYTYSEFSAYIAANQQLLQKHCGQTTGLPVGVMCHDSIETFAAIFAIWFSGHHFVPLNPLHPLALNNEKIQQSSLQLILSSEPGPSSEELKATLVCNKDLKSSDALQIAPATNRAYILFTSGSTGIPKGVVITSKNMEAFIDGFMALYPDLTSRDRFLQTYDLTSDAAFTGYLIPLLIGASVYTLPAGGFKYLSIVKILEKHHITWTQFTPSVLNYLRPYFKSLQFHSLQHSHFGGEALPYEILRQWAHCVPNAEISNIYGPTETTITCTIHRTNMEQLGDKVYNGLISIGKPLNQVKTVIVDENNHRVKAGEKGELCIGGPQVMEGYLNLPSQDDKYLFVEEPQGPQERYYRSGDLVIQDQEGFLFYLGRKDEQLKISGYRVEPAEIEYALSSLTNGQKAKAYGFRNQGGAECIVVFVEQCNQPLDLLKDGLRTLLPAPLIPEKIISINQFPINSAGKVDKNVLFETYSNQIYE
ncbi:MAG TPA: AMP-binding protein [Prolixibacteraceae bacterium]|nr:AMP-binding protein [Prolixibacteraceae bacterium]